jgi:integrase
LSEDTAESITRSAARELPPVATDSVIIEHRLPEAVFWGRVREELIARPHHAAKMTGIPEVANLKDIKLPMPPITLMRLRELYRANNESKEDSRREACKTFDKFVQVTKAKTLEDLTTETLKIYRDAIRAKVKSPGTIAAYFGRVKWIIAFGKGEGEDAVQIDAALSRMAVLKAPKDNRTHQPTPISREAFHAIYKSAGEQFPGWRARTILMLNLCLDLDECLDLEWSDFDMDARTFCTARNKRGRVIRAAILWPETVEILKTIKRTGSPYVLVSQHGGRFNANGQWKTWNKLRVAAGCSEVQMDDIRDGAYTAACSAPGVDEKYSRLLAGHRSHGLQDNYVQRNPGLVSPACEAVYQAYGPFPVK